MEGCRAKKGHWCQRTVAKCANCRGPHFAQARVCAETRAACNEAKGWRSPPPTWRQRGKPSPLEELLAGTKEAPRVRPEVEEKSESALGEAMEE